MSTRGGSGSPEAGDAFADRRLLRQVAEGDAEAFGRLIERHQDRLLRLCERLLGEREAARDAVQEVFLKVYRQAAGYRPRGQVYTWLYRIAVNHCLNRLRRRKIVRFVRFEGRGHESPEPSFEPADPGAGPEARLQNRERWRWTLRALARLPPGQRSVVVLAKLEGLSYKQIAETLGITVGAVESRLVRAMKRLHETQEEPPPSVPEPGDKA